MSFADDVRKFVVKVEARHKAVFVNTASHAHESIVTGSGVTGAPGQPVDTGNLKNSWQITFPSAHEALVSTNVEYAEYVENGVVRARTGQVTGNTKQRLNFRVGGPHSVRLTVLGFSRIVEHEAAKVVGHG